MSDAETIRKAVKSKYAGIAEGVRSGCCDSGACGRPITNLSPGYAVSELAEVPRGADLGLGCGNPVGWAQLAVGEIVIDLGSGAGIDCFLAAHQVGDRGMVIGVDMTEEMLSVAEANAIKGGYSNVVFRQGNISHLPVESSAADVVISNCVINLAPDKREVYGEIYRALKPGGRFIVSDIVAHGVIREELRNDMEQWAGCVAGAMDRDEYLALIARAGFERIEVKSEVAYDYKRTDEFWLSSMTVMGYKPSPEESS